MFRLNLVSLIFAVTALLSLSACQTGSGYSAKPWAYGTAPSPAEQPPNTLGEAYGPSPGQNAPQAPQENLPPVKVAILLPLSGQHAALGQAMLNAAQVALFDVGYAGFELLPADTKGTSEGAREAARSVLQDGAKLILGPVFADEVRSVRSVTNDINIIAFSTDWTLAGGNTFIMGFLPFDQIERVVTYAATHNRGNIGVLAPQTDYGRAVVSAYRTMAARTGVNANNIVTFAPSANLTDTVRAFAFYDQRQQATMASGALPPPPYDAVLMPVGGDSALMIANLLSQNALSPSAVKRLGTGLFDDPALAVEPSLAGAWFAAPSPKSREAFEQRYLTTYSARPPRLASLAYDATALAAALAQRGLRANGQAGFDANSIRNPNGFAGVDGIFRFRSDGNAERGLAILEFKNGRVNILEDAPRTFQPRSSQYI